MFLLIKCTFTQASCKMLSMVTLAKSLLQSHYNIVMITVYSSFYNNLYHVSIVLVISI